MIDQQGEELNQTKSVFGDLDKEIGMVGDAVDNIRNEVEQLNNLKNSVMGAVDNLAAIAQENAASTEETSASMQQLGNLVAECKKDVEQIVIMSETLAKNTNKFTLKADSDQSIFENVVEKRKRKKLGGRIFPCCWRLSMRKKRIVYGEEVVILSLFFFFAPWARSNG